MFADEQQIESDRQDNLPQHCVVFGARSERLIHDDGSRTTRSRIVGPVTTTVVDDTRLSHESVTKKRKTQQKKRDCRCCQPRDLAVVGGKPAAGCSTAMSRPEAVSNRPLPCQQRAPSRLESMPDDILVHIFSYLGHGKIITTKEENNNSGAATTTTATTIDQEQLLDVKDACKVHTQIATLSRTLRRFCDDSNNLAQIFGLLNADFDKFGGERNTGGAFDCDVLPCIVWLCKYNLRLGLLNIHAEENELDFLTNLIRTAETSQIRHLEVILYNDRTCSSASLNFHRTCSGGRERRRQEVGDSVTTLKVFHDTIARECPNLSYLSVNGRLPAQRDLHENWKKESFSPTLFSMPRIRWMKLSLGFMHGNNNNTNNINDDLDVDHNMYNVFWENLPALERLDLGSPRTYDLCKRGMHVQSPTLKVLHVGRLPKWCWVSCKCPSLQRYICVGHPMGNGTRPNLTPEQWATYRDGDALYPRSMIGLDVPSSCECVMEGFSRRHYRELEWIVAMIGEAHAVAAAGAQHEHEH